MQNKTDIKISAIRKATELMEAMEEGQLCIDKLMACDALDDETKQRIAARTREGLAYMQGRLDQLLGDARKGETSPC